MNPNALYQSLSQLTDSQHFLLAYSGGLDSHVLLSLMHAVMQTHGDIQCRVIHVNHHLHSQADEWVLHCQQVCAALSLPLIVKDIHVDVSDGESVEARARELRYQELANELQADECLLTAHHLNDQAETLLLQLLRGAGPKGLSAMPVKKLLAGKSFVRPLLNYTREQLQTYAQQQNLQWIEDSSNHDQRFQRNFVRQQVMPLLQQTWPQSLQSLARSSAHCAEAAELLDELAIIDFDAVKTGDLAIINLSELLALSPQRQRNVLRFWFRQCQHYSPTTKQLLLMQQQVLLAKPDANPMMQVGRVQIKRFRQQLFLLPMQNENILKQQWQWDFKNDLTLPDQLGVLCAKKIKGQGIALHKIDQVTVRFRQGGEVIQLQGRQHQHALKKLLQQWCVPPWQRDRMPLLFHDDKLIAVPGYCVSESVCAKKDDLGWQIYYDDDQKR